MRLGRLLRSNAVEVHDLDVTEAMAVGIVAGKAGIADVVDCSVVLVARRTGATVVTSDAGDITSIDPTVAVVAC